MATFLSTNFDAKTGLPASTIFRRIQYDIFESSVRRSQNCFDNVFICVTSAKKKTLVASLQQVDRQQRSLYIEMSDSDEREDD